MVTAIVLINAEAGSLAGLGQMLADTEGVYAAYSVAGDEDFVALVRAVGHEELADIVTTRISKLPGILSTRTLIAFRTYSSEDLANI